MNENRYKNGQKIYEQIGNELSYYFKDGKIKAKGNFLNKKMEGTWLFYRATGELWQEGNFKNNEKHGTWIRYNINGQVEYNENFFEGKKLNK